MWQLAVPWWEMVFRAAVIYTGVFVLFRFLGKKQLGQLSPFDFVLIVIVSESVSNGLAGEDHSLTGALISAATLLTISRLIDYGTSRSQRLEKFIDGEPMVIIRDGKTIERAQRAACITTEELLSALRQHEVQDPSELQFAILERNGKISVVKKEKN